MSTVTCPIGHESTDPEWCDTCGARIGGQAAEYLTQALTEYREGKRRHPTMQAQAQSFSEQDIADISAYLSSLK